MTATSQAPSAPVELESFVALARREHSAGRLSEAAAAYRKILALRPDIAEAYYDLGNVLVNQGDLEEAAAQHRRAVALKPDFAEAHNSLGFVLQCQGKFDEAAAQYERALALRPGLFEAHNNLGNVHREQGKIDLAIARFEQAIALRPDLAEPYYNLGNVLRDQGRLGEAATQYQRAVTLRPDLAEAYNSLGCIFELQRKLGEAAAQYERAVALKPGLVQAQINLGNILREQGKFDLAVARYRQAIVLRPDLAEAHYNLGNVLKDQDKLDEAAAQFQRALTLKPDLAWAHNNLGAILREQGKLDLALAQYAQALALKPDFAEAYHNRGNALKDLGKLDLALASYEQSLALRPDYAEVHCSRTDLKTFRRGDADLATLEALAEPGRLPSSKRVYIHFALGKALEDVGDYSRAFEHLLQGNALRRQQIDYDEAAFQQTRRLVANVFDSNLLAHFAGLGDPSSAPIFVLGMPRSGSTLVEQILASHPQVHAAGELNNLTRVIRGATDSAGRQVFFPIGVRDLDGDGLRRLGQAYLAGLPTPAEGQQRITDKAPGNFLRVGLIHLILPNARIIHTTRDPVDTCVSCFSKLFSTGVAFSYELAELGRYYRGYHELMAHWRSVLPAGAMLDVSYEDVVDNLEQQARRLIDFCGLPWDDRCLSFHKTSRSIATSSNVQVRRPLYRSSVARWRRYEAYLQPLLAELDLVNRPREQPS